MLRLKLLVLSRIQYRAEKDLTWQEQELNAVNLQGETYTGGFTLPQLRPATVYLARVASKNAYGYNDYGTVFKFATKGAGERRQHLAHTKIVVMHTYV